MAVMTAETYVQRLALACSSSNTYRTGGWGQWNGSEWQFDCIGLIKSILWGWVGDTSLPNGGAVYEANGVPDATEIQLINMARPVSFEELVPGTWLYLTGHMGVFVGEMVINGVSGNVIEATTDGSMGVQLTRIDSNGARIVGGTHILDWKRAGLSPFIEYAGGARFSGFMREYTPGVYDLDYNHKFDITIRLPMVSESEFYQIREDYVNKFGKPETVITLVQDDGTPTAQFEYLNQKYGIGSIDGAIAENPAFPLVDWSNNIRKNFTGLGENQASQWLSLPVTRQEGIPVSREWRDFYLSDDGVNFYGPFSFHRWLGGNDVIRVFSFGGSSNISETLYANFVYGSGRGSLVPPNGSIAYLYFTWVICNEQGIPYGYKYVEGSGYGDYSPRHLKFQTNGLVPTKFDTPETGDKDFGAYVVQGTGRTVSLDPTIDPYNQGGSSTSGGGSGSFDNTGDYIDIPDLPTVTVTESGFITLYNPTKAQLLSLSNYMWSGAFDINTFRRLFADPMDAILGLTLVPVAVPDGGLQTVKVGNISTGIQMTKAASQYVEFDCGELTLDEYWGAYMDYAPYTKVSIYLPFIGIRPLSTDDVMGKPIRVVYHIDILSGACHCYLRVNNTVLYDYVGQCAMEVPITSNDFTNAISSAISIGATVGAMAVSGGASAPLVVGGVASTAHNIMNAKPNVQRSGSLSGVGGLLGVQIPYIIIERPRQCLPAEQNKFTGYPAYFTDKLVNLTGFTQVEEIHIENTSATETERSEILALLREGVIL